MVSSVMCHTLEVDTWVAGPKQGIVEVRTMDATVMDHTIGVRTLALT